MANPYFQFKQFTVFQDRCAMKVTTDGCLFGAWCAESIRNLNPPAQTILDIGSGTGLLSLMVEQKNPVTIEAVEIDEEAAKQAINNFKDSPWRDKLQVIHTGIQTLDKKNRYDCIISNPPFYENELTSRHERKNLAHHSAQLTFVELLNSIQTHLNREGVFFLLLPFKRIHEMEKTLSKEGFFIHHLVRIQQSSSHPPFRVMIRASTRHQERATSTLSIRTANQQYSPEFTALLKDYYLYL